ncbi:hypothetical protein [Collibacillus ludicampi]|uniref:hypothetical protein n=1 Tax=Collibacillus ludicampi TaxID=2771369 RepID=UPI002495001C|nr:hypothetical protein [Collibacillus ludicampi]
MKKSRTKRVFVKHFSCLGIIFGGVVQVGDVGTVSPFTIARAVGGFRGAPSFTTMERAAPTKTRLHYANQRDTDNNDLNIYGEQLPNP